MDNGKRSLSTLIDKTVPYLEKIKDIEFYISIDYLSEKFKSIIYNSDNIVPVSGVKDMHQRLAETDFLIARGGFNTISECLVLKKPALFFREENNDEIAENLRQIYNKRGLANLIKKDEWGKNIEKKLRSFIKTDGKKLYKKLSRKKFKFNGASQVVKIISKKLNNKF